MNRLPLRFTGLFIAAIGLSGCNVKLLALRTTADILGDATQEIETEDNWHIFKDSVPAALKTLEGLLYVDPTNEDLLVALTKGYAAYGFAIYETEYLDEKYAEKSEMPMRNMAIQYYQRSIDYGLRWMKIKGMTVAELTEALNKNEGGEYLSSHLNTHDNQEIEGAFFLGQSWLSFINLQRDKPALVAQIGVVKGLFDWTCHAQPDFRFGACQVFYAAYEASRPKMLGGNPEKGRELFLAAIKKYPANLFIRTAFLEYYVIPALDHEAFKEQKGAILGWMKAQEDKPVAVPGSKPISLESKQQKGQIYNSIALRRFQIMRKFEESIF